MTGLIIFGTIIGVLANIIDRRNSQVGGMIGAVILAVLGAVVSVFLISQVFKLALNSNYFLYYLVAFIGAAILLFASWLLKDTNQHKLNPPAQFLS